ncbi:MAG: hypothetical protein LUD69_04935 [Oscillospiraceae bacterium]|nr:hypothetical protein [Oscillospiraceae bacterium]
MAEDFGFGSGKSAKAQAYFVYACTFAPCSDGNLTRNSLLPLLPIESVLP